MEEMAPWLEWNVTEAQWRADEEEKRVRDELDDERDWKEEREEEEREQELRRQVLVAEYLSLVKRTYEKKYGKAQPPLKKQKREHADPCPNILN